MESLLERCLQARHPNLEEIESKWNAAESGIDFQTQTHRSDTRALDQNSEAQRV